ncbi:MAG: hypothetical protein CMLOHMNK_01315 [Steroidobacteraceae bacterium]|nr:hypothetical protein [Steroidobacteraceae bacterium]
MSNTKHERPGVLFRQAALLPFVAALAACVTSETRPLPKVNPVQATTQIPEAELLDVGVRIFDANIPAALKDDEEALAKKRIYPEVRNAEAGYLPGLLRATLETSGQWGAVRVVPEKAIVDVIVTGRILESTGAHLALAINVSDSTGRVWIRDKEYQGEADLGSYKTEAALEARDPFQNVYSEIANDMLAARNALVSADLRDIRRVTSLRFASDFAPDAAQGYLATDAHGVARVARLPAEGDPVMERVGRIRERDLAVIDTVNSYYANFADKVESSYGNFRRVSQQEIEKEDRARASARTRTVLGAAAVLASVLVPNQCGASDYTCRNVQSAARTAGAVGGVAGIMSGIKKYSEAKVHAEALKELADTFRAEVTPQVVEVEGRTLKLTGSAEEQYREWRELLRQIHLEDTGSAAAAMPVATGPAPTPPPVSRNE